MGKFDEDARRNVVNHQDKVTLYHKDGTAKEFEPVDAREVLSQPDTEYRREAWSEADAGKNGPNTDNISSVVGAGDRDKAKLEAEKELVTEKLKEKRDEKGDLKEPVFDSQGEEINVKENDEMANEKRVDITKENVDADNRVGGDVARPANQPAQPQQPAQPVRQPAQPVQQPAKTTPNKKG